MLEVVVKRAEMEGSKLAKLMGFFTSGFRKGTFKPLLLHSSTLVGNIKPFIVTGVCNE